MTDNFTDKLTAARSRIAASLLPKISSAATAASASKLTATPMGNNLKEHIANGGQPTNDMINYFNDKTIADGVNRQNISDAQQNDYFGVSTANLTSSNVFMAAAANAANLAGGAVGTLAQWGNTLAGDEFTSQAVAMEAGTPAHVVDAYNTLNRTREQKNQLAEQSRVIREQIRNKQGDPIQLNAQLLAIETAYKGIQVDPNTMTTLSVKTGDTTYLEHLDASQELRHKGARVTAGSGEGFMPGVKSSDFSNPYYKKPLEQANKGDQFITDTNALADRQLDEGTLTGTLQGIGNKVLATGKSIGNVLAAGVENPMGVLQYTAESAPYFALPGIGTIAIGNQTAVEGRSKFETRTGQALPTTGQNAAMLAADAVYMGLNYVGDSAVNSALRGATAAPVRPSNQILLDAARGVGSTGLRAAGKEGFAEGAQTYLEESGQNLGTYFNPDTVGQAAAIGAMSSGVVLAPSSVRNGINEAKANLVLNSPAGQAALAEVEKQKVLDAIPLAELQNPTSASHNPVEAINRMTTGVTEATKDTVIKDVGALVNNLQNVVTERETTLANAEQKVAEATKNIPIIDQLIASGNTDPRLVEGRKNYVDYLEGDGSPQRIKEQQDAVESATSQLINAHEHAKIKLKAVRDAFNIAAPAPTVSVPTFNAANPDMGTGGTVYPYPTKDAGVRAALETSDVTKNYTPEQREVLRVFSEAVVLIHSTKELKDISIDISKGGNAGGQKYRGLEKYMALVTEAINNGNVRSQQYYFRSLAKFSQSHTSKAQKFQEALDAYTPGMVKIVQKNDDTNLWEIMDTVTEDVFNAGNFKKDLRKTGGFGIHNNSAELVAKVQIEAEGIAQVSDAINLMVNGSQSVAPISAVSAPVVAPTIDVQGINIHSKEQGLGKDLTNPNNAFPIKYEGREYSSVEHAYQSNKSGKFDNTAYAAGKGKFKVAGTLGVDTKGSSALMVKLLKTKLEQYPQLVQAIKERGGVEFLNKSTHDTGAKDYWTTKGSNGFITALSRAYTEATSTVDTPIVTEPSDTTPVDVTPAPEAPVQSVAPATPATPTETKTPVQSVTVRKARAALNRLKTTYPKDNLENLTVDSLTTTQIKQLKDFVTAKGKSLPQKTTDAARTDIAIVEQYIKTKPKDTKMTIGFTPTPIAERAKGHKAAVVVADGKGGGKYVYEAATADITYHYVWDTNNDSLVVLRIVSNGKTGASVSTVDSLTGEIGDTLTVPSTHITPEQVIAGMKGMVVVGDYVQATGLLSEKQRASSTKKYITEALSEQISLTKDKVEASRLRDLRNTLTGAKPRVRSTKPKTISPDRHSLLQAIKILGGVSRAEAKSLFGFTDTSGDARGVLTNDGKTFEAMAEALGQDGYPVFENDNSTSEGNVKKVSGEALFNSLQKALNGEDIGTDNYMIAKAEAQRNADLQAEQDAETEAAKAKATEPKKEVIKAPTQVQEPTVKVEPSKDTTPAPEPVKQAPAQTTNKVDPKTFTNHSGGAKGYDAEWDIIGAEFGFTNNNHYLLPVDGEVSDPRLKAKGVKPIDASKDVGQVAAAGAATGEAQIAVTKAERAMGRIEKTHTTRNTKKIRNYAQVKNADGIFAIGSLIPKGAEITIAQGNAVRVALVPQVNGGTSIAVQLGIMMDKPTYVFNQVANGTYVEGWYKWDKSKQDFVPIETPILTKNFAGIGTSSNTTLQGKQAIKDVYVKTLASLKPKVEPKDKITSPISEESKTIYGKLGNKTVSGNVVINKVYQLAGVAYAKSIGAIFSLRVDNSNKHFGNPFSSVTNEIAKGLIATKDTKESVVSYIDWVLGRNLDTDGLYKRLTKVGDTTTLTFNDALNDVKVKVLEIQDISGDKVKLRVLNVGTKKEYTFIVNTDGTSPKVDIDFKYGNDPVLEERRQWIREQLKSGNLKGKQIVYYKELGEPSHATALDYLINKYDWETKPIATTIPVTPKDTTEVVVVPESVVPVTPPDSETGDVEIQEDVSTLPEVSEPKEKTTPAGGLSILAGTGSVKDRMKAEQEKAANNSKGIGSVVPIDTTKADEKTVKAWFAEASEKANKVITTGIQRANLVVASFYQKAKAPSKLVQVKDFAKTVLAMSPTEQAQMLSDALGETATDDQVQFLENFLMFNKSLRGTMDTMAVPTGKNNFRFKDYLQYLFTDVKTFKQPINPNGTVMRDVVTGTLDENIKTAISVGIHTFLIEKTSQFSLDHEGVAELLGFSNTKSVPYEVHRMFKNVGNVQPNVVKYLGTKAYQALQLSMDPNVPAQRKESLINALGSLAVQTMLAEGLLQYTRIPNDIIKDAKAAIEGGVNTAERNESIYTVYLRPAYDTKQVTKNGWTYESEPKPIARIEALKMSAKGNTKVMSKLFSVDGRDILPMLKKPTKFTQDTLSKTGNEVPDATADLVLQMMQKAYNVNGYTYSAMKTLFETDPDALYAMVGVVSDEDIALEHITKRGAIESKNEALKRSVKNGLDFIDSLTPDENGNFPDFYLPMSVGSVNRVYVTSNLFNEQGDKVHRALTTMIAHKQQVTISPVVDEDNKLTQYGRFLTGVAAYMEGVKINDKTVDKTDGVSFLPGFEGFIKTPVMQDAIKAVGSMVMGSATDTEIQLVKDMVISLDGGAMSLTSLIALYEASQAKEVEVEIDGVKTKVEQFTTSMSVGSDGVTNGMAISILIYDAASPIVDFVAAMTPQEKGTYYKANTKGKEAMIKAKKDAFDLANPKDANGMTVAEKNAFNAGGIFFEGDEQTSMAQFRKLNRQDLYQQLAKVQKDLLKKFTEDRKNAALLNFIAAMNNIDPTFGTRAGAKVSLVPFVYGSGFRSIGAAQSRAFMEQFYKALTKAMLSGDAAKIKQFQDNYVALAQGARIPVAHDFTKMSVKDALDTELSLRDVKAITGIENKIRKAITKDALSQVAGTLIQARSRVSGLANVGFESYNRIYTALQEMAHAKLKAANALPYRYASSGKVAGETVAVEGMNVKQNQAIDDELKDFTPQIISVGGVHSVNGVKSAHSAWEETQIKDTSSTGEVSSEFGDIAEGVATPNNMVKNKDSKSITTSLHTRSVESRGAATNAAVVQAMDAWITAKVSAAMDTFNHHDENVSSIDKAAEMGQLQNKTLFNAVLDYDVYLEVLNGSLLRPLRGIIKLSKRDDTLAIAKTEVGNVLGDLTKYMKDNFGGFNEDMGMLASLVHGMYALEIAKLTKYKNLKSISQYGIEGGEYTVTKKDVARINDLIASHVVSRTTLLKEVAKMSADLKAIGAKPKAEPEVKPETKEETPKGKPASVDAFIVRNEEGIVDTLATLNSMPINDSTLVGKVIKQVVEALKGKLPTNLKVHMLAGNVLPAALDNADVIDSLSNGAPGITYSTGNTHTIGLVEGKANKITFIHELIHASTVSALQGTSAEARKLNSNVSKLRSAAQTAYRNDTTVLTKLAKEQRDEVFNNAFKNNAEFIAMAMSEPAIIDFLATVPAPKISAIDTGLISIFSAFIKSVSEFLGLTKNTNGKDVESVLSAMVNQTAQLMNINDQSSASDQVNNYPGQQAAVDAVRLIREYPSKEVFNVLPASLDVGFDTYLSSLMDTIVDKTFNRLSFPATTYTPLEVWENAITDGRTPYTTRAVAAGFILSERELFAIETLEVALKGAMDAGITTPVYKEMERAYESARKTLKDESFYNGDWSTALESDREIARNKRKHLFKLEGGQATRSDYMSRFMAMALASSEVNSLLGFPTLTEPRVDGTISSKILAYYEYAMDWVSGHLTGTMRYQTINAKLPTLAQKLVDIDHKKRDQALSSVYDTVSDNLSKADAYLKESGNALADKLENMIGDSKKGLPSAARTASRVVLRGAAMDMLNVAKVWRDMSAPNTVLGWKGELLNELSDPSTIGQAVRSLLRINVRLQTERKTHKSTTTQSSLSNFLNGGKNLSKDDHSAITYGVLRGDLKALYDLHGIRGIEKLLNNADEVDAEVARLEGLITNDTHLVRGKDLAHYMTSGEVNLMLAKNALSIARDVGLPTVLDEDKVSEEAVSNIDMLVSLYAIQYMKSSYLQTLQKLFKQEGARTDGNGLAALMKYHQAIEQEAKDTLFEGNSVSIIKGYTPEITNPHREIKIVTLATDAKHLEAMGYQLYSILSADPNDVNQAKRMVYFTEEPSTQRFVTGAMSLTADSSKGTSIIDGSSLSVKDKFNALKSITTRSATKLKAKSAKDYDPTAVRNRGISPTYSNLGSIQDFRYEMTHATRDGLLQRNNNFAEIMGTYAGSNFDKASTPKHNETVIDALYKDYKENYLKDPRAYVMIGKDATDPKAVEMYAMLPYKTRKYIDKVWGKREPMWVRNDALLATFGTNKYSIGEAFEKNPDTRNIVETTIVDMFKVLFGDTAKLRALQGERLNQELVSWFKSTIVIRNLTTLMGNQSANVGVLLTMGVSPVDIIKDSVTAFKAGNRFRKDNTELVRVENNMKANVGNFEDNVQLQARLKDSIARNPLKQFLDAGMLNTIVEDVSLDVEDYNYKSKLAQQLDDQLDKLNPTVRKIGANLVVAPSTELYQVLANATQLSDFTAKYTLYKHLTTKAKDKLSHEDALAMADRMFINYDVPTSKELQYANDMGFLMFTKYTLRIQRAIAYLLKERKASLLAQGMLGTALGMPLATAPAFFLNVGLPFHAGALGGISGMTQPLPIKVLSGGF